MTLVGKTLGRTAAATSIAAALVAAALAPPQSSRAGPQQPADMAKTAIKVTIKEGEAVAKVPDTAGKQIIIEKRGDALVANPPDQAAIEQGFVRQFGPLLRLELRIMTSVAAPTPAQRREVAIEGGRTVKEVAKSFAAINNGKRPMTRNVTSRSDPRKLIHDAVVAAAKAKLAPDQFARFQEESDRKAHDRREVVLLHVVAKLDQLLILSSEQRAKLQDALRAGWDDRTYPQLDLLAAYEAYFPAIPDAQIKPLLTEAQQRVWQDAQKFNFGTIRTANGINNWVVNNPPLEEEDPDVKAALAEEVKL